MEKSVKEIINEKWKEAFKARDMEKRTAYEMIKQKILVAEKSGQYQLPLTDEQITNLIIKEIKEREDVMQFYKPEDDAYKMAVAIKYSYQAYLNQYYAKFGDKLFPNEKVKIFTPTK